MDEGTDGDERVSTPLEIGAAVSLPPRGRSAWSAIVRALFAMRAGELALWVVGVGATGARDRYVVVTCIEPEDGNAKAIGFDLSSDPVRAEAIDKTLVSHTPAATARIRLVQETGSAAGVLLLQAVVDSASHANLGCVSAVLRIDDLFDRSLRSIPSGSSVALYDRSSDEKDALYTVGDPAIEESGYRVDLPVNVADRPWLLRASIAPGEVERRMSTQPWAWFVAGLVTTWLASRTLRSQRAARDLLRNVLPRHIAERLTKSRRRVAERHDNVSVLFADIVGFTVVAGRLGADELVR